MKFYVWLFGLIFSLSVKAQEVNISVSALSQTINVTLDDDNTDSILTINSLGAAAKDEFIICNKSWKSDTETDYARRFMIYDDNDSGLITMATAKEGKYAMPLKEVLEVCKKAATYKLYTIAIPKDPAKAALVKVRRILVCKIEVQ